MLNNSQIYRYLQTVAQVVFQERPPDDKIRIVIIAFGEAGINRIPAV